VLAMRPSVKSLTDKFAAFVDLCNTVSRRALKNLEAGNQRLRKLYAELSL